MDVINDLISHFGFPVAVCVGLGWYILKKDKEHMKEREKFSRSVDNNTKAMTELIYYLKGGVK